MQPTFLSLPAEVLCHALSFLEANDLRQVEKSPLCSAGCTAHHRPKTNM